MSEKLIAKLALDDVLDLAAHFGGGSRGIEKPKPPRLGTREFQKSRAHLLMKLQFFPFEAVFTPAIRSYGELSIRSTRQSQLCGAIEQQCQIGLNTVISDPIEQTQEVHVDSPAIALVSHGRVRVPVT
jgi:hypothetical protein